MLKRIGIGATLISLIFILTACAGATSTAIPEPAPTEPTTPVQQPPSEPITPTTTEPDTASGAEVNPKSRPSGPIEGTWIEASVNSANQTVTIPVADLEDNWNIHFNLETSDGEMNFMAYIYEGELHVRANVCPPCRSIGYALDERESLLICDMCATLFNAGTGAGIEGACVDYPKAEVQYQIADGQVVMNLDDLTEAYEETLIRG